MNLAEMGAFFSELKRRHVYRVAAAYSVVAWVLLQLVNNLVPVLELPSWIARAMVLLLALWFTEYAPLRKTERFKTLVRKVGLVDYWRARGWPDRCRPMGADDFVCG